MNLIPVLLRINTERFILSITGDIVESIKFYQKLVMSVSKPMNAVISKPKLPFEVPKTILIIRQVSVEILRAIEAFLEDNPATAICCLVTEYMERPFVVRVDMIDAILLDALLQ